MLLLTQNKIILIFFILLISITVSKAIREEELTWAEGNVYKLTPKDNMATEGSYTIKAVDFPPPVRGRRTVNDTIVPENPVLPFVTLEIYKDIINNPNPVTRTSLARGDQYITPDQDLRITLEDIPVGDSQDWVYESYNAWASIRIQKIGIPNMDIKINFTNSNGDIIDIVNPGDSFLANIDIKNTGEDAALDINYNIKPNSSLQSTSYTNKLTDTIPRLNKDEEKINQIKLVAPINIEERDYEIYVNVTAHDIKNVYYYWNNSGIIKVNSSLGLVNVNKQAAKTTIYLKEYAHIFLNIANAGPIPVYNIHVTDAIPDNLLLIENNTESNLKKISFDKKSLAPDESWAIDYLLKPIEPGVFVLPKFTANFSMRNQEYSVESNEEGFRVYGPIVVLKKSAINEGNNVVDVRVSAKNIGNGFTRVVINDDALPDNAILLSGTTNMTLTLDADEEKSMSYKISIPGFKSINVTEWHPAMATYYLEDYSFTTSSDKQVIEEIIPTVTSTIPSQTVAAPKIEETEKKVVATIPVIQEKKTPGFELFEFLIILILLFYKKIK